jgi:glycosyltransferase involved in cell wall biosynthesis
LNNEKPSLVVFYTYAYNAENTIKRTIESILSQTYENWVWYLLDNGSTDKTGEIIHQAAECDSRIIPLTNKKNHVMEPGNEWREIAMNSDYDGVKDYFCFIDADDEYKPEFLEKMVAFSLKNNIGIVCCGNDEVNTETNKAIGTRVFERELIIHEKQEFSDYFPYYHQFMRTTWAKIYRIWIIRSLDWSRMPFIYYSGDTVFVMECFRIVKRVGILPESLHIYYRYPKSLSYTWDNKRLETAPVLHKLALDYLADKCGFVSPVNEESLLLIYMYAIRDTLNVLMKSDVSDNERLEGILDIFSHEYTKRLAEKENIGTSFGEGLIHVQNRHEIFANAVKWLLDLKEIPVEIKEKYYDVSQFMCEATGNPAGWVAFEMMRVSYLKDNLKSRIDFLLEAMPDNEELKVLGKALS